MSFCSVAVKAIALPASTLAAVGDTLIEMTVTVKLMPLLASPPTVTTALPVVAPAGTFAVILVEVQDATGIVPADVPLNVTVLVPWVAPKFAPEIVTEVPTEPLVGLRLEMVGATWNATPLLATPPTVTTTFPLVAPDGTCAVILVAVHDAAGIVPAETPLNVTVLVPCVVPKLIPEIVMEAPTNPDVGFSEVMVGLEAAVIVTLAILE